MLLLLFGWFIKEKKSLLFDVVFVAWLLMVSLEEFELKKSKDEELLLLFLFWIEYYYLD